MLLFAFFFFFFFFNPYLVLTESLSYSSYGCNLQDGLAEISKKPWKQPLSSTNQFNNLLYHILTPKNQTKPEICTPSTSPNKGHLATTLEQIICKSNKKTYLSMFQVFNSLFLRSGVYKQLNATKSSSNVVFLDNLSNCITFK